MSQFYIHAYLRASTADQDAKRAKAPIQNFLQERNLRAASWHYENGSGAELNRPVLLQLLNQAENGDIIICEQIDRLSRLSAANWEILKDKLRDKQIKVISLDLPTSHQFLTPTSTELGFTDQALLAINNMMLDLLAAISRKDYEDRARRQLQGIEKAKKNGVYKGRTPDLLAHENIYKLRVKNGVSIRETAALTGVSERTVLRVVKKMKSEELL